MSSIITTNRNSTITAPTYTRIRATPRNSAPARIQVQATVKNVSTRNSAACTGFLTLITAPAEATATAAKARKASRARSMVGRLSVGGVGRAALGDLRLEAVADRQQLRLGEDVLAAVLEVVFVDVGLDDRVHRARLLAESAIDALEQVDVVSRGATGTVLARRRIDGDRQRRAHRLAQLAGDAALFPVGVAAQRVQPAEARRLRRLLHRVHQRVLGTEQVLQRQPQPPEHLQQQQAAQPRYELAHHAPASNRPEYAINATTAIQPMLNGMKTFQPSRMIWS